MGVDEGVGGHGWVWVGVGGRGWSWVVVGGVDVGGRVGWVACILVTYTLVHTSVSWSIHTLYMHVLVPGKTLNCLRPRPRTRQPQKAALCGGGGIGA